MAGRVQAAAGEQMIRCLHKNCPMTWLIYVGADQYLCWLHAFLMGMDPVEFERLEQRTREWQRKGVKS